MDVVPGTYFTNIIMYSLAANVFRTGLKPSIIYIQYGVNGLIGFSKSQGGISIPFQS